VLLPTSVLLTGARDRRTENPIAQKQDLSQTNFNPALEFNMKWRREFSIWISLVTNIRVEAKRQGVSTLTLVRKAIEHYLDARTVSMILGGRTVLLRLKAVNLNEPEVYLTPEEMADADEAMRIFREEDR
jgi:hypothetical protein